MDFEKRILPITVQAELLSLNRSSLYYEATPPSENEICLKHAIDQIYTDNPFFGSRRITAVLNRSGIAASRPTVQKYMREMGICAIYPKPNLSKRNHEHRIYPYLLNGVKAAYPNHIWGIDITYIRLSNGWLYLVAFIDWFSRYVIDWELDFTLEVDFVIETLKHSLILVKPEIINSDQGCQFTSMAYIDLLKSNNIKISMDGKNRALDNIFTERLWRSLKYEEVYIHNYQSPREARIGIGKYFEKYNNYRPHQSLNYLTPAEVYFGNYTSEIFEIKPETLKKPVLLQDWTNRLNEAGTEGPQPGRRKLSSKIMSKNINKLE